MDFNLIGTCWSLLPPVVAIALALKTKEVYSSLFIGIILGAALFSYSMGTGFEGFLSHLLNDTVERATTSSNTDSSTVWPTHGTLASWCSSWCWAPSCRS